MGFRASERRAGQGRCGHGGRLSLRLPQLRACRTVHGLLVFLPAVLNETVGAIPADGCKGATFGAISPSGHSCNCCNSAPPTAKPFQRSRVIPSGIFERSRVKPSERPPSPSLVSAAVSSTRRLAPPLRLSRRLFGCNSAADGRRARWPRQGRQGQGRRGRRARWPSQGRHGQGQGHGLCVRPSQGQASQIRGSCGAPRPPSPHSAIPHYIYMHIIRRDGCHLSSRTPLSAPGWPRPGAAVRRKGEGGFIEASI